MKRKELKGIAGLWIIFMLLSACSSDEWESSIDKNDREEASFSKMIFFLNPYIEIDNVRQHILTDTLYNVSVKIDGSKTFTTNSLGVNSALVSDKATENEFLITSQKMSYPVVMNIQIAPEKLETAGQYADMLNDYFTLSPGIYVCQIESFTVKTISGRQIIIYTPELSYPLEVKAGQVSENIGEFDVRVNL